MKYWHAEVFTSYVVVSIDQGCPGVYRTIGTTQILPRQRGRYTLRAFVDTHRGLRLHGKGEFYDLGANRAVLE